MNNQHQTLKRQTPIHIVSLLVSCCCVLGACSKSWLDVKSNKSYVVPATLGDYQAILDYDPTFNASYTITDDCATDDYFIPHSFWLTLRDYERDVYGWVDNNMDKLEWEQMHRKIFYANAVLDGIMQINVTPSRENEYRNIRGAALFYRAMAHYWLAQLYCAPYNIAAAANDPGLPLRLIPDPDAKVSRSTVAETYASILSDLVLADSLLNEIPLYKTRPSRRSAKALLARVYLTMGDYEKAGAYATGAINLYDFLMDYNNVQPVSQYITFPLFNEETIFHAQAATPSLLFFGIYDIYVDTLLYAQYEDDDLRKELLFSPRSPGRHLFRGSYTGRRANFKGIAVNEMYLIKAECEARAGQTATAMQTLNTLLRKRWKTGTFADKTAADAEEALRIIIRERRKELLFTGLRWTDIRRFSTDPRFAVTLTRKFDNGDTYTLPPGDKRYTFLIPMDEINLTGIPQNER